MINRGLRTNYTLRSLYSNREIPDTGWILEAQGEDQPSLLRAVYEKKQLEVKGEEYGLYKYSDWLPISRVLQGSAPPVTYRSNGLANHLGLKNLYITFSGYWPERGAFMETCSFKETEAYTVCARLNPNVDKVLVVASAGNTARSFARVCSVNRIPLLLCVPEDNLDALWFDEPVDKHVKLVCTRSGSDYFDAIHLSNLACLSGKFIAEGGAKNVARRDGMGTTVLSAIPVIGKIPDYYFQAVGSGTGAIAAWEANIRFIEDGRYGSKKMKLMVSQNAPFTPIYDAWRARSRDILHLEDHHARKQVERILAKVLSNRRPPYSIIGGLYDALIDTGGDALKATNEQTIEAAALFKKLEGNDIHPAAAVATATLIREVQEGRIDNEAIILLNITGGGEERFKTEKELFYLKPDIKFDIDPDPDEVVEKLNQMEF